jgi:Holliday junction resolvase
MQQRLTSAGLLCAAVAELDRGRGRILGLTDEGRQLLGIVAGPASRRGGLMHRYWQTRLADHLRQQGYGVQEEAPVGGGKAIDIVAVKDGKRIAFEIETGESDVTANIEKCLDADMDNVVVVAVLAGALDAIARAVGTDPRVRLVRPAAALEHESW